MNPSQMGRSMRSMISACALMVLALPLLSGCGGGVATEPTVSIKRDKGGAPAAGGGTAPVATATTGAPAAASGGGGTGSWKGKVILEGAAPDLAPILKKGSPTKPGDEVCVAGDLPNERLVVGEGGGVANTFVFLSKPPAGATVAPVPKEPAFFDQKNCKFIPHALLVRAGQPLLIQSGDPIAHNTHTFPNRNTLFNQTIPVNERKGIPTVYAKAEAEPIEVKCDFHTWMHGYHFPIDHQFAALSGPDGSFEIKDLPAGEHKFKVWHEGADGKYISRAFAVNIKPGETTTLDIPYPVSKFAP